MAQWIDHGILLEARKHGESRLILTVLTQHNGLCKGVVRKSKSTFYEPGTLLKLQWQARLSEHMGMFTMTDSIKSIASEIYDDYLSLMILKSLTSLLALALPERHPYPEVYEGTRHLIDGLATPESMATYMLWEKNLLSSLGFGLDLSKCGATGTMDDLTYVSPKTGRAISRTPGLPYHHRLFYLPEFLKQNRTAEVGWPDLFSAMEVTGYFISSHLFQGNSDKMPDARARLKAYIFRKIDERQVSEA
jgi:DNA repair protein RecO (recombination protein O)